MRLWKGLDELISNATVFVCVCLPCFGEKLLVNFIPGCVLSCCDMVVLDVRQERATLVITTVVGDDSNTAYQC